MDHRKERLLKFIYLAGFLDNFAVSIVIGLMIKAIRNHGISPSTVGIIGSIYGTLQIFSAPIIGSLGDIYERKQLFLLSYIFPAIGYIILGTTSSLSLIVLSRIINGIFKQGQLCCRAYLTELTPPTNHSAVLGHLNASSSVGFIIGPLIGGQLAVLDPTLQLPFLAGATIFTLNAILIFLFVPSNMKTDKGNNSINTLNWRTILSKVNIFSASDLYNQADILLFRFVSGLSVLTFRRNLPILLEEIHHVEAYNIIGAIISFNAIIGVIASSLSGRISKLYTSQKTLIIHMSLLMCVAIVTAAWSPWLPLLIACTIPLSLATANLRIATINLMLLRGEPHRRGALIGIGASVSSLARAISPSMVGVAQELSSQISGGMSGVLSVISVGITVTLSQ